MSNQSFVKKQSGKQGAEETTEKGKIGKSIIFTINLKTTNKQSNQTDLKKTAYVNFVLVYLFVCVSMYGDVHMCECTWVSGTCMLWCTCGGQSWFSLVR